MNNLPLNQRTQINIPEAVDSVFTAYAKSGRLYAPDISNRAVIDANPEVWQEFVLNALTIADSGHEAPTSISGGSSHIKPVLSARKTNSNLRR